MAILFTIIGFLAPTVIGAQIEGLNFPFTYSDHPQPFKISVDPAFIRETVQKAALYRPSKAVKDYPEWNDGPPPEDVNALAHHWATKYDWFSVQDEINTNFSHFTTSVPGSRNYQHTIPLHFVHEKSSRPDATPLLLLHGWPSTHLEWSQVIHPLLHPTSPSHPAFHIVAPDLPGYGFSPAPAYPGQGVRELGAAMDALMQQLGYATYGLVTTDMGWFIGNWMAADQGARIRGHMSDFAIVFPNATDQARFAAGETSAEEARYMRSVQAYQSENGAYGEVQATRPMALALGMADSPVGWAGWVWQVLRMASDGFGYGVDELITTAMVLWIQGPFGNVRSYKECWKESTFAFPKTHIPTGLSEWSYAHGQYPGLKDIAFVPRSWVERFANVTYFVRHESGGHFPSVSRPTLWVHDVRQFFAQLS